MRTPVNTQLCMTILTYPEDEFGRYAGGKLFCMQYRYMQHKRQCCVQITFFSCCSIVLYEPRTSLAHGSDRCGPLVFQGVQHVWVYGLTNGPCTHLNWLFYKTGVCGKRL